MVLMTSTMLPLGTQMPDFSLPDAAGNLVTAADVAGKSATVVAVWCNHCPYVKQLKAGFADFAAPYGAYDYGLETALPVGADFAAPYGYPAFDAPVYASEAPFYPAFDAVAAPAIEPAYVAPFYEAPVEEVFTTPIPPMDTFAAWDAPLSAPVVEESFMTPSPMADKLTGAWESFMAANLAE